MRSTRSALAVALAAVTASLCLLPGPATAAAPTIRPDGDAAPKSVSTSEGSYNGLALTPPMGWNSWNKLRCAVDEEDVRGIADAIVAKGLDKKGYRFVTVDDCWMAKSRDAQGNLTADPERFPSGMKALGDYLHARGLKFGLYESPTQGTCQKRPGSYGHEQQDADKFAEWGVDYLKHDWCQTSATESPDMWADFPGYSQKELAQVLFPRMAKALEKTGRPIVYSLSACCEDLDFEQWARTTSNLWRTSTDIADNWASMVSNFEAAAEFPEAAGPGGWNDPDMLEVGNGGMTDTEYRSHMSLWSVLAAPLIMGNDLRTMSPETERILGNKRVIAVDQDPLGKQATVVSRQDGRWVLSKELADGSRAVALFNATDQTQRLSTTAAAAGLDPAPRGYAVRDLWSGELTSTKGELTAEVPAHGTVLLRVSPRR
ncbi:glycoside hydrolase family 27 protein [Streptomyces sp. NA04227]|uniref:glycoside hydrolase family 27 protein n=1 Tax=Streptomyces sp. NA04227 TaxID=2742136 RepID=UPI001590F269|nr:glycoside hydrolase family 27 protein [Streptomyces sp. NA04227]QKW08654.1 glycoside hydrolase family 27 protein [Streptomyces sp. NA04227]